MNRNMWIDALKTECQPLKDGESIVFQRKSRAYLAPLSMALYP